MIGRQVVFTWGGAEVEGVREKGVSLNGSPVDLTSDEDNGWRALDETADGENSVDISLSGVTKDDILKTAWFANDGRVAEVTLTYPDGGVLTGNFKLASFSESGPYKDAVTFEASLQSSGEVVYTPAGA